MGFVDTITNSILAVISGILGIIFVLGGAIAWAAAEGSSSIMGALMVFIGLVLMVAARKF